VSVNVSYSTPYLQKLYDMEPLIMNFVLEMWLAMQSIWIKVDCTFTGLLNMVLILKRVDIKLH